MRMKFSKLIFAMILAIAFASCTKDVVPSIKLSSPSILNFEQAGATQSVSFNTNVDWIVAENAEWITLTPTTGTAGDVKFDVTVTANPSDQTREADITLRAGTLEQKFTVKQGAVVVTVTPAEIIDVAPIGEVKSVVINSNAAWTISSTDEWLGFEPTSGVAGETTVAITVLANTAAEERTGIATVDVSGLKQEVTVKQQKAFNRMSDSLALVAFYNATDGANWDMEDIWNTAAPMTTWKGVRLNAEGRVDSINLGTKTIKVPSDLVPEIGNLTQLTYLDLGNNNLKGVIPASISNLVELKRLDLSFNDFTSGIEHIKTMMKLEYLMVYSNDNLEGTIPAEVSDMVNLWYLHMGGSKISGPLPSIAKLTNMKSFMFFKSSISGTIPDEFANWTNLEAVMIYDTEVSGPLPASLGSATGSHKSFSIMLYNNNFEGNIPENWANMPAHCKILRVQGNKLSGVIPAALKDHPYYSVENGWKPATYMFPQQEGFGLSAE